MHLTSQSWCGRYLHLDTALTTSAIGIQHHFKYLNVIQYVHVILMQCNLEWIYLLSLTPFAP